MTNLPTPELQAAVERVNEHADRLEKNARLYPTPVSIAKADKDYATDLRLILAALEERGKALEWYADPANYEDFIVTRRASGDRHFHTAHVKFDKGKRALTALGETPDV